MTTLYDAAKAFAKKYPSRPASRSGGTWSQLCGILVIQFGGYLSGATAADMELDAGLKWKKPPTKLHRSADEARSNSGRLNTNHLKAPVGAFHFWDNNHVGIDLKGRGQVIFMASEHLKESWGSDIGVQKATGYPGKYLGWSKNYAGGEIAIPTAAKAKPAPAPVEPPVSEKPAELEPTPDPTPAEPPAQDQEDPMPTPTIPTIEVPQVPDVILPPAARDGLYIATWLAGVILAAIVAGWLATGYPAPTWLLVAVAVYGSVSSSVVLIAKANVPKAVKASAD